MARCVGGADVAAASSAIRAESAAFSAGTSSSSMALPSASAETPPVSSDPPPANCCQGKWLGRGGRSGASVSQPSSALVSAAKVSASGPPGTPIASSAARRRSASARSASRSGRSGELANGVASVISPRTFEGSATASSRAPKPAVEWPTRISGAPPRSARTFSATRAICVEGVADSLVSPRTST
jgi:hypothetical protein